MQKTNLKEMAGTWDSATGAFISARHQRLAEILHDYNPHFSVVWVPPKNRDETTQFPFAIVDSSPGIKPYIMRYLTEEQTQNPAEILTWVFEGDLSKHRAVDIMARMELRAKAEQLLDLKKREDQEMEERDKLAFIAKTPLNKFKIGDTVYRE